MELQETRQLHPQDVSDTRSFENASVQDANKVQLTAQGKTQPPGYERSLSEDLLAGEEENFKASYTDDEDDEDHITVTLSNTSTSAPTIYTSSGDYGISRSKYDNEDVGTDNPQQPEVEDDEDDLSNLDPGPALDFLDQEPHS